MLTGLLGPMLPKDEMSDTSQLRELHEWTPIDPGVMVSTCTAGRGPPT